MITGSLGGGGGGWTGGSGAKGVGGEVGLGCPVGWLSDDGLLRGAIVVDEW